MEKGLKKIIAENKTKQRSTISFVDKLEIIRMYESGKDFASIARQKKRPVSTIKTIVKNKDRIKDCTKGNIALQPKCHKSAKRPLNGF